jgi:hypothetical protein
MLCQPFMSQRLSKNAASGRDRRASQQDAMNGQRSVWGRGPKRQHNRENPGWTQVHGAYAETLERISGVDTGMGTRSFVHRL